MIIGRKLGLTWGGGQDTNQEVGLLASTRTWWTFRIFFIFVLLGGGEGGVRATGKGGVEVFLLKIPGGGGFPGGCREQGSPGNGGGG